MRVLRRLFAAPSRSASLRCGPRLRHAALATVVLLAGCRWAEEAEWRREVGVIDRRVGTRSGLAAPAEARAGVPFEVIVTTDGTLNCTRADGAAVEPAGARAVTVVPFDRVPPPGTICLRRGAAFPRAARVRFDSVGAAAVRVRARDFEGADVIVEAAVVVRP